MGKQTKRRTSKSAAIKAALDRLGWHANAKDVVAFLAKFGVDVDERLVCKVKLESLKGSSGVRTQGGLVKQRQHCRKLALARKAPTQRTYRS